MTVDTKRSVTLPTAYADLVEYDLPFLVLHRRFEVKKESAYALSFCINQSFAFLSIVGNNGAYYSAYNQARYQIACIAVGITIVMATISLRIPSAFIVSGRRRRSLTSGLRSIIMLRSLLHRRPIARIALRRSLSLTLPSRRRCSCLNGTCQSGSSHKNNQGKYCKHFHYSFTC